MSDFTSNFWNLYVAILTIVSILACALLLWFSGKAKAMTASDNTQIGRASCRERV